MRHLRFASIASVAVLVAGLACSGPATAGPPPASIAFDLPAVEGPTSIPSRWWVREVGRSVRSVAADTDGNVYAAGWRSAGGPGGGPVDPMVVVKFAPDGTLIWSRSWLPRGNWAAWAMDVAVGPGTHPTVYVAGKVLTFSEITYGFLRAYDADGRLLWMVDLPPGEHANEVNSVAAGPGFVVVAGDDHGCCADPYTDGWVRAYGSGGGLLWVNHFEAPRISGTYDLANSVAVGPKGQIFVAGWIETAPWSERRPQWVDREVIVQRLTHTGSVAWTRVLRQRGDKDYDQATSVAVAGGEVMVGAMVNDGSARLMRFHPSGRFVWSRTWPSVPNDEEVVSVSIDRAGAALTASTQPDSHREGTEIVVRKYRSDGSLAWSLVISRGKYLAASGVVAAGSRLAVSGWSEAGRYGGAPDRGWVWTFRSGG